MSEQETKKNNRPTHYRMDVKEIKDSVNIVDVINKYVSLKRTGKEWVACCPFHKEDTESFSVNPKKGIYKCFGCGEGGDVVDFLVKYQGVSFTRALEILSGQEFVNHTPKRDERTDAPVHVEWKQIVPAPAIEGEIKHYRHGVPSKVWTYHTVDGQLVGYVCRFDLPEGKKEVLPFSYATNGTETKWRWMGFDRPRPVYRLYHLNKHIEATVVLVEGEKAADAAQAELDPDKFVVVSWPGGSQSIEHIDWSPLFGRHVIAWPDNDLQGLSAMLHIRYLIEPDTQSFKLVPLDYTLDKGWDCADKKWNEGELERFFTDRAVNEIAANDGNFIWRFNQVGNAHQAYRFGLLEGERWSMQKLSEDEVAHPPLPPVPDNIPPINNNDLNFAPPSLPNSNAPTYNEFFDFLGWEKTEDGTMKHYFFAKSSKAVLSYKGTAFQNRANLINLAPLNYWQMNHGMTTGRSSVPDTIVEFLIMASTAAGPFNPGRIRGRGAWIDDKRVFVHSGDKIIVNGQVKLLGEVKSRNIYECGPHLGFRTENPLPTSESDKLLQLCERLTWERPINSYLLAGWCVIAPICGALKWRPHIWLTGSAGTGKSWVFLNIVRKMLGETALAVQGDTTEPGLRQTLKHDALPVVFDEADTDDRRSAERIQNILTLMRAASADDGGLILKGSTNHASAAFKIRSCFAFASIGVQVSNQSDRSRVSILALKMEGDKDVRQQKWVELNRFYTENITDEFVSRLQARTISLMPTIIKNAATFSNAVAAELGGQRVGDQLGAILAGAYSLRSSHEISYQQALDWIREKDWSEEREQDSTKDEILLFQKIMGEVVTCETISSKYQRTVGELVMLSNGSEMSGEIPSDYAHAAIKRIGIKVEGFHEVIISNSSQWIKRILADTPWSRNHNKILMRLKGARAIDSTKFSHGIQTRAVALPIKLVIGD